MSEAALVRAASLRGWRQHAEPYMSLVKRLAARTKEIEDLEKQFGKVKDAAVVLKAEPLDPEAPKAVGGFQCTVEGDWEKGLRMLALGNE